MGGVEPVVDWADYYAGTESRSLRPLLAGALELAPRPGTAIDLGSGSGLETLELLARGWRVISVDAEPDAARRLIAQVSPAAAERLEIRTVAFEDLKELPAADLVHAALSLPFCRPEDFDRVWKVATRCLRPGGLIAADLFGRRDSWADAGNSWTFHGQDDVDRLLTGLEVLDVGEEEYDGPAFSGPKHWHLFHVFARRPV